MNKKRGEKLAEQYPSLQLAYEHVKNVLNNQGNISRALDAKASTLIALATGVTGIGIPIGISALSFSISIYVLIPLLLLVTVPIYFYYRSFRLSNKVLRLHRFRNMDNPLKINEFWSLANDRFQYDMICHIRDAFKENLETLTSKASDLGSLRKSVMRLTIAVIGWSFLSWVASFIFGRVSVGSF